MLVMAASLMRTRSLGCRGYSPWCGDRMPKQTVGSGLENRHGTMTDGANPGQIAGPSACLLDRAGNGSQGMNVVDASKGAGETMIYSNTGFHLQGQSVIGLVVKFFVISYSFH